MHVVADTEKLVVDGIITPEAAREMEIRGRDAMVTLAINAVLCFGILSATLGLIFWLGDALSVAIVGAELLALGLMLLARTPERFRMFGNAAVLIGVGMLMGGIGVEMSAKYGQIGAGIMIAVGAVVATVAGRSFIIGGLTSPFIAGSIAVMGVGLHLWGLGFLFQELEVTGLLRALAFLYATGVLVGTGMLLDLRLITALAIVPFAQMLDTGTSYFHAAYVFYSPEPTFSIVQMTVLLLALAWGAKRLRERQARHSRVLSIMGFVVANLCALVGSLFGDRLGITFWGPGYWWRRDDAFETYGDWRAAREAFEAQALVISAEAYTVLWAVVLVGLTFWLARRGQRGLFNTAVTFAAIHAYTQLFETFGNEPLAFVAGGFAAIPLAWGMWRLNQRLLARAKGLS